MEEHEMGDGQSYYVSCLWFNGKKDHTITVQVQSSDFAPDIFLVRDGAGATRSAMTTAPGWRPCP